MHDCSPASFQRWPNCSVAVKLPDLLDRWRVRRDEWRRLGVQCDGAKLCDEVLADLHQLDAAGEEALSLVEAAKECSYSADHLGRLVRNGDIENVGRKNAPRIRRRDLPRKPAAFPPTSERRIVSRARIAASVLTPNRRGQDG